MKEVLVKAIDYIDDSKNEMLNLWEELVNIDSGSSYKEGIDKMANKLKSLYEDIGFDTKIVENPKAGNTLVGKTKEERDKTGIVFMGHMDTVFEKGTAQERPFKIIDGKAFGPGVLDMKGGLVVAYFAAKALQNAGYLDREIKVVFSGDEETGHKYTDKGKIFIDETKGYAAAFNCETGYLDNGIVVERKGSANFTLEIKGVSAHAGNEPENGRSAILEAAYKTIAIHELTDMEEGTTYNVGTIKGGTVANAVPDYVKMEIDVRFTDVNKFKEVNDKMKAITDKSYVEGTKSTITGGELFKPMVPTEGVMKLFEQYKENSVLLGFEKPYPKKVGGGSDSAYSVMSGVPTICALGVKGEWNHSPNETADVETLFERTKLLIASVINFKEI